MSERASTKGRERPILFSAPMVRALLAGTKTQTRRILKPQPYSNGYHFDGWDILCHNDWLPPATLLMDRGKGKNRYTISDLEDGPEGMTGVYVGERLWVREAWARSDEHDWLVAYRADGECGAWQWDGDGKPLFNRHGKVLDCKRQDGLGEWGLGKFGDRWRSPIHLPRKFSRLTLTITDVHVHRINEIKGRDIIAEGVRCDGCFDTGHSACRDGGCFAQRIAFENLWDSINGLGCMASNPWVAAYTFTVERRNIDEGLGQRAGATPNPLSEGRERS